MQKQYDLGAAVAALTEPRLVHTSQPDPVTGEPRITTVEHPALIDLLEHGTGTARSPRGGAGSGDTPIPIDANALETWAQIREQVRAWLRALRATWTDELKTDLRTWYVHHERAVAGGRVRPEHLETIERLVEGWQTRIEQKYDPDERREWTEPCPSLIHPTDRWGAPTGQTRRCGARRLLIDGVLQFAIALNITKREAHCRSCGRTWIGDRELMQLRYEANLAELEQDLVMAPEPERRDLTLTGPIDLP